MEPHTKILWGISVSQRRYKQQATVKRIKINSLPSQRITGCSCSIMSEISQLGFFINLIVHLWVLHVLTGDFLYICFFARNQSQEQPLDSGGPTAWKWDVQASGHHHDSYRKTNEKKDAVFVFPKDPSVGSLPHGCCWQPLHDPGSSWAKLTVMGH